MRFYYLTSSFTSERTKNIFTRGIYLLFGEGWVPVLKQGHMVALVVTAWGNVFLLLLLFT